MLYSLRMRAELEGKHVSGAERIINAEEIEKTIKELLKRPKLYDKMVITIENIKDVEYIPKALPIYSYDFKSVKDAHNFALSMLMKKECQGLYSPQPFKTYPVASLLRPQAFLLAFHP